MNFGSLQIGTLWRLSKAEVCCNALVVEGVRELRLIVVENGQIVHWERFPTAGLLRRRAVSLRRERTRRGWGPAEPGPAPGPAPRPGVRAALFDTRDQRGRH